MTLREIFTALEGYATSIPDIRTCVENDMTKLNTLRSAEYGVFGLTQDVHTEGRGFMTYSLNLFYIDRLLNSQDNQVQIQSHGIEVLKNIIRMAREDGMEVGEARFTSIQERFQDECAGVWAAVSITVPESECVEI